MENTIKEIPANLKKRQLKICFQLLKIKGSFLNNGIIFIGKYEVMPYYINLSYIEVNMTIKKDDGKDIHVATIRDMGNLTKLTQAVKALI